MFIRKERLRDQNALKLSRLSRTVNVRNKIEGSNEYRLPVWHLIQILWVIIEGRDNVPMPTSPFNIWEGKHFRESLPLDLGSYYATRKGSYMVHSERLGTGSYSSLKLLLLKG